MSISFPDGTQRVAAIALVLLTSLSTVSAQSMFGKVNDFDGDGRADYAITRSEGGLKVWYIWQSMGGFRAIQWGLASDAAVAGDYGRGDKMEI